MDVNTGGATRGGGGAETWANWAGNVTARPARIARPTTPAEVEAVLTRAAQEGRRVRPVGSGHSFTALAGTDGVLVDVSAMCGLLGADDASGQIWVRAGTTLAALNALLAARGRALANLGDIDRQTVAGAVGTGTHGTGAAFAGLASFVTGLEIVTPAAGLVRCDATDDPELFRAATVGLGAFGIVTALRIATVPAFRLSTLERTERLGSLLPRLDDFFASADHAEFYWFPYTDLTTTKRLTRLDPDDVPGGSTGGGLPEWRRRLHDDLLSNTVFGVLSGTAARVPRLAPLASGVSARGVGERRFTDASHAVFCSRRAVRFRECEYAVPVAALRNVLRDLTAAVPRLRRTVTFPVEVRVASPDDVWLSTGYQRANAYVAVHQHVAADPTEYFAAFEAIAAAHEGRPHWGKEHSLDAERLEALYPRMRDAKAVRARVDPDGLLRNAHLDRVLRG